MVVSQNMLPIDTAVCTYLEEVVLLDALRYDVGISHSEPRESIDH